MLNNAAERRQLSVITNILGRYARVQDRLRRFVAIRLKFVAHKPPTVQQAGTSSKTIQERSKPIHELPEYSFSNFFNFLGVEEWRSGEGEL